MGEEKKMGINKKVQSKLANDVIFYRFTTKHVRLTIMLVTGLKSVSFGT